MVKVRLGVRVRVRVRVGVRVRVPPVLLHLALEASQLDLDPALLARTALAQQLDRFATVAAPARGGRR